MIRNGSGRAESLICNCMNGIKKSIYNVFYKTSGVCFILFCTIDFLYAQGTDDVVNALVNAGYENVSREIGETEEVIMFENTLWGTV